MRLFGAFERLGIPCFYHRSISKRKRKGIVLTTYCPEVFFCTTHAVQSMRPNFSPDKTPRPASTIGSCVRTTELVDTYLNHLLIAGLSSDNLKPLLRVMGRFPHYSLHNQLLVASQLPEARHLESFNGWRDKYRRHVRRGEHGLLVASPLGEEPCFRPLSSNADTKPRTTSFKEMHLFDLSQTDGEQMRSWPSTSPENALRNIEAMLQRDGWRVLPVLLDTNDRWGSSAWKEIRVVDHLSPSQKCLTLLREYAHDFLNNDHERRLPLSSRQRDAEALAVGTAVLEGQGITESLELFALEFSGLVSLNTALFAIRCVVEHISHALGRGDSV